MTKTTELLTAALLASLAWSLVENAGAQDVPAPDAVTEDDADGEPGYSARLKKNIEKIRSRQMERTTATYDLLIDQIGLSPDERTALIEMLANDAAAEYMVAGQDGEYRPGREIDTEEQFGRIEALIGSAKAAQFRKRSENIGRYGLLADVSSALEARGTPVQDDQREGLLEILVSVHARLMEAERQEDDDDCEKIIERGLEYGDTMYRLILEQAPGVLDEDQVVALDAAVSDTLRWQRERVEQRRKRRPSGSLTDAGCSYPAPVLRGR